MKGVFRFLLALAIFLLIGTISIGLFNTFTYNSRQIDAKPIPLSGVSVNAPERLGQAIRIPTVSQTGKIDTAAFIELDSFLQKSYPWVDSFLTHTRINQFSHIYQWSGRKASLEPILLMGHLDVVPAGGDQLDQWSNDPFSGLIEEGFIKGRGAMDDKGACLGILEAVEQLLKEDYIPERTVYLAFGHDEEISGFNGAKAIVEHFSQEKIRFAYILDEGMFIVEGAVPGLDRPFAGIGIAEKGYVTLQLEVKLEEGGHSSMPPSETAIGILSSAIYRLQENPLPASIDGLVGTMFDYLGPEMSFPLKFVFANRWLTNGLVKAQLSRSPSSNAMMRTTIAPTIVEGGVKDNVLPLSARAKINFRILPGETIRTTRESVEAIIKDARVNVTVFNSEFASEPSEISSTAGFGFNTVQKTIREVFPEAVVAPALVIAATDARHYERLSQQVLRFFPIKLRQEDLKRIHGVDERIGVEDYKTAIRFYKQLIINSAR